jgi:hypothetical protein
MNSTTRGVQGEGGGWEWLAGVGRFGGSQGATARGRDVGLAPAGSFGPLSCSCPPPSGDGRCLPPSIGGWQSTSERL